MLFNRLMVANRGEIAIRIFRAATELEIRTIGIFAHEDRFSIHRYKADEAYKIGTQGNPLDAYLNWPAIIEKAKELNIDAIHPGYGFLSENAEFANACEQEGITFIGPPPKLLRIFGDKIEAKKAAQEAGITTIPGSEGAIKDLEHAKQIAAELGYPITFKAQSGGGGKGIRIVRTEQELAAAYERSRSEAATSFGQGSVYIEKTIINPKHIEVQIAGDKHGQIVHLFERDCSVQRRHQKVVEVAPALGLGEQTKEQLYREALALAKSVNYQGLGTVEFLVDGEGKAYFLEVNPRIQVEHTVTEMVTGVDLVQASIVIAAGRSLSHPAIGINSQDTISSRGVAIQCRITTEDPQTDFAPDTGRILAYRPALGFGIRLDGGTATTGAEILPFYDSLLVKVTAFGLDFYGAARKMLRSLREFRIRGVKTNIPLLVNIISHPKFYNASYTTNFFTEHPELFKFPVPRDRATKMLKYLADVTINDPHELPSKQRRGEKDSAVLSSSLTADDFERFPKTAKQVYADKGVSGLVDWIKRNDTVLLTDTTMRDAHQSLFATRMRSRDILRAIPYYRAHAHGFFSLEVWGGATFDTCLRFLKEDPWQRLADVRSAIPNTLLQMLLRGDNAVGYTNYPAWVIRDFIRLTIETGLDLFRIFDCLNNPEQMEIAIDEVKKRGAIAEACICYTGNVASPNEQKYTLDYYVSLAKRLEKMGADILCIKDMAGLLRPNGAHLLISALKQKTNLPIHLHTHDTSGNAIAMLLAAAEAGCDIVDGAISSMSGLTSQPSLNALVAALEDTPRCPPISLQTLDKLGMYWEGVRTMYQVFDPGIKATSTRVYEHEIPGGQYSNLYDQARKVGVSATEFFELTQRYQEVNQLLGNIIKVTPSSKVVGDMALLLQKHNLTGPELLEKKPKLDYPDSVISFFKGHMGIPYGGFPEAVRELVLGKNAAKPHKPEVNERDSLESVGKELENKLSRPVTEKEIISYRLYPKVFLEYMKHRNEFDRVDGLPTPNFFYGLEINEEIEVDLEPGKTLIIALRSISEPDDQGYRTVFFDLNGYSRTIKILDQQKIKAGGLRAKADSLNPLHVPAAMPGKVIELKVKENDAVSEGQTLMVTESMKMEYAITAKTAGTVKKLLVSEGDLVEGGDLLVELSE